MGSLGFKLGLISKSVVFILLTVTFQCPRQGACPGLHIFTDREFILVRVAHLRGAWVAQSTERLTLDFGSGRDPRVMGWSLRWAPCSAQSLLKILSLPLSLSIYPLRCSHVLSLSLSLSLKKQTKKSGPFIKSLYTELRFTSDGLFSLGYTD